MKIVNRFNSFPYIRAIRISVLLLAALLIIWAAVTDAARIKSESKNNTVELCLDWDEVRDICAGNNYPLSDFLERAKAIGASSVALPEEGFLSLAESGNIIFFNGAEYNRARLIDIVAQGGMVTANMVASTDKLTINGISETLRTRYGVSVKQQRAGKYYLAYPAFEHPFLAGYLDDNTPLGFSAEKIKFIALKGLQTVYKLRDKGNPAWIVTLSTENVSGVMWADIEIPGYQGREKELSEEFKAKRFKYISTEFTLVAGEESLKRSAPELLVRGHSITEAELGRNQSESFWLARWMRAVKEREIRFLYFHFWKNMPVETNIAYLRSLSRAMKQSGFTLDTVHPPAYPIGKWRPLRGYFVLALSLIFPVAGLMIALRSRSYVYSFLSANAISLFGGLLVSAILYDALFMQKIVQVPMVRMILFLPLLISVFILFDSQRLKELWNSHIRVKYIVIAGAIMAAGLIVYVRSGNNAPEWLVPDSGMRQVLENLFWIRPRTKEFLLGQPLLLLGFYLKNPWLILAGMIGQVSILNTFMHSHTTLFVSIARTLTGMGVGFALGILCVEISKLAGLKKE